MTSNHFTPEKPDLPADPRNVLETIDGNLELFQSLLDYFFSEYPGQLDSIREGILSGDGAQVQKISHFLKGSVVSLGGQASSRLAFTLETMGLNNDLSGAMDVFHQLEAELDHFKAFFSDDRWQIIYGLKR